jgi:hypothetical protein
MGHVIAGPWQSPLLPTGRLLRRFTPRNDIQPVFTGIDEPTFSPPVWKPDQRFLRTP